MPNDRILVPRDLLLVMITVCIESANRPSEGRLSVALDLLATHTDKLLEVANLLDPRIRV